jgi:hypothetical protein
VCGTVVNGVCSAISDLGYLNKKKLKKKIHRFSFANSSYIVPISYAFFVAEKTE